MSTVFRAMHHQQQQHGIRKSVLHIKNAFYSGQHPPSAVIALNSPTLGSYEHNLLSTIFDGAPQRRRAGCSAEARCKPLFLCADGAYSKIAQRPSLLNAVDMVVGDGDSLLWWKQQEAQQVNHAPSTSAPTTSAPPPPVSHIVLHHAAHFGCDRHHHSSVSSGGSNVEEANVEHFSLLEQSYQQRKALFVRVLDQNSTDFEKCLTVCERVLMSPYWNNSGVAAAPSKVDDATRRRQVVLVLGFQGGEWHHEMAALHAGAKYSASGPSTTYNGAALDLRFHAPNTTIAFCNPNGDTVFERNVDIENKTFAIIPFGESPTVLKTTGLKWNLDYHRSPTQPSPHAAKAAVGSSKHDDRQVVEQQEPTEYFGFTNAAVRSSYISTSNRIVDPDGRVVITAESSDACVVALAIHLDTASKSIAPPPARVAKPRLGVTMLVYRDVPALQSAVPSLLAASAVSTTEYLLIQRGKSPNKGMWGCPGGSVEWGEATLDAAVRELKEETGLSVDGNTTTMPLGVRPLLTSDVIVPATHVENHNVQNHFVLMHFAAQYSGHVGDRQSPLKASDDATSLVWASKADIHDMIQRGICIAGVAEVVSAVEAARCRTAKL